MTRSNVLVSPVGAPSVTSTNLALANAFACTGCRTVAAAIQAVLIYDANDIQPVNLAHAQNSGCNSCATYAFAAQYVVTTGGPAHLSPDGETQVAALRQEVANDVDSGIPFDLLTSELDDVYARLQGIVNNDLVQAGGHPSGTTNMSVDPVGVG